MENLYKELRSFFANDIDLNDLFDSEAIIWIDWREYDEDVVNYFNDMMDEPIDIQTVSNGKPYGDDIVLKNGNKELQIPYGDEQDRDVTIKYFNDFVKPDYEVRWFAESLGNDTLGFTVLSGAEWANLDDEFGADTKEKAANKLAKSVSAIDEDLEIEIHDGGQSLYPFLISVE